MASQEFHAHQARIAAAPRPSPDQPLAEKRARADAVMGAIPLAPGIVAEPVSADGVPAIWLRGEDVSGAAAMVYFHGGGYRMGSATAWQSYASQLAARCGARVLLVDYRLAPEHPFPAALDDAVAAVRWLVASGEAPERLVVAGDSAGGGLAAATLLALRDAGDPLPAGGVCLSPWADLTNCAASFSEKADTDALFSKAQADEAADLYLAGHAAEDPRVSPALGDLTGLPPLLIHVGDVEVLFDDAQRLAAGARRDGVDVQLSVYPEMPHVWHMAVPAFPEAVDAVDEIARFVERVTGG
ncbi:alpha/beta hydrolase [Myxococcota bacterium]|nr:alpha/beta hydrolase [Myxococcota bacterium]